MVLVAGSSIVFALIHYFGVDHVLWFVQLGGIVLLAAGLWFCRYNYVAFGFGTFSVFLGLALSSLAYRADPEGWVQAFYWGFLPGAPFVVVGVVAVAFRSPVMAGPVCGAFVGAAVAVGIPYGLMWYSSANYSGGGANIGLGLLLLAVPLYLPVAIAIGAGIGFAIDKRGASRRAASNTEPATE